MGNSPVNVARQSIEIDVPPQRLYALIVDFERYPGFVPNQSAARVVSHEGNRWRVAFELTVARRLSYTLDLEGVAGERLSWTLVEGDMMRTNEGRWMLEALPGDRTRATYEIEVVLKGPVPGSVSRLLAEHTLPRTLASFKAEAERRG